MRLKFSNAAIWKYVVSSIAKIIEEGVFKADAGGLRMRALDSSNTALIDLVIPKESFAEYEVGGEERFGVNFEDFSKILKLASKGDELALETFEGGRLGVTFHGHGTRTFILPNIEVSTVEELSEIELEFPVTARIQPAIFADVLKELEVVGDVITLESEAGSSKLVFSSSSDVAEAKIELSLEDGSLLEYAASADAKTSYSMEYLVEISRISPVAEGLTLSYGPNMPMRLVFDISQGGRLTFYVSPRVE